MLNKLLDLDGLELVVTKLKDRNTALFENKVDKETNKGLSTNDYTTTEKDKLGGIAIEATRTRVKGSAQLGDPKDGDVILSAADVGVPEWALNENKPTYTKSDVGLNSVSNYGIALEAEAKTGTTNVKYMTPLRTSQAIAELVTLEKLDAAPVEHDHTIMSLTDDTTQSSAIKWAMSATKDSSGNTISTTYIKNVDLVDDLGTTETNAILSTKPFSARLGLLLNDKINDQQFGESFENISTMVNAVKGYPKNKDGLKIGYNFYIVDVDVPDFWVNEISDPINNYTYTTDEALIQDLRTNKTIKIGYYEISLLETAKVDLSDYAKKTELLSYVKTTTLADYAKKTDLTIYAKTADLASYVKTTTLNTTLGNYQKITDNALTVKDASNGSVTNIIAAINRTWDQVVSAHSSLTSHASLISTNTSNISTNLSEINKIKDGTTTVPNAQTAIYSTNDDLGNKISDKYFRKDESLNSLIFGDKFKILYNEIENSLDIEVI